MDCQVNDNSTPLLRLELENKNEPRIDDTEERYSEGEESTPSPSVNRKFELQEEDINVISEGQIPANTVKRKNRSSIAELRKGSNNPYMTHLLDQAEANLAPFRDTMKELLKDGEAGEEKRAWIQDLLDLLGDGGYGELNSDDINQSLSYMAEIDGKSLIDSLNSFRKYRPHKIPRYANQPFLEQLQFSFTRTGTETPGC